MPSGRPRSLHLQLLTVRVVSKAVNARISADFDSIWSDQSRMQTWALEAVD